MTPRLNSGKTKMRILKTEVAIVGGGPAGMLLAHALGQAGISTTVLEQRSRAHVLSRIRAGVMEPSAVKFLRQVGMSDRMDRIGRPRDGTAIAWQNRPGIMIDVKYWTGLEMMAYGQTYLTEDLYAAHDATGAPLITEVSEVRLDGIETNAPAVHFRHGEQDFRLECKVIAGCDGARGVCAQSIPADVRKSYERHYPFGWLGIMVERPPINDFTYIYHEDGFALAAQRGPNLSRYYVQAPLSDTLEDWPDDRFWETFLHRAPPSIAQKLAIGPSIEKSLTALRSQVTEPMRHGRLFLAGDSAHLVPPTGAKGLNLAISDVRLLSEALIALLRERTSLLIDSYSQRALKRVWAAENLSWRLTKLLHVFADESPFEQKLRLADYDLLLGVPEIQHALAFEYAGLPF
jgi:p-hydroxybenzoate 3-monooxygenase